MLNLERQTENASDMVIYQRIFTITEPSIVRSYYVARNTALKWLSAQIKECRNGQIQIHSVYSTFDIHNTRQRERVTIHDLCRD